MSKILFFLFTTLIGLGAWAQSCPPRNSNLKSESSFSCSALKDLLQSKGFVCDDQPVCKGRITGYPEPVLIMIPTKYRIDQPVHFHFHGHNLTGDQNRESLHYNRKNGQGDYLKFANEAGNSSLMVFPLSNGKCTTFLQHFKSKKDLDTFRGEISKITGSPPQKFSLSFHSGSDVLADRFLNDPSIDSELSGMALFDALYAERTGIQGALKRWEKSNAPPAFSSYYVANSATARYNEWLKKSSNYGEFFPVKTSHMGIMADGRMSEFFKKFSTAP